MMDAIDLAELASYTFRPMLPLERARACAAAEVDDA
jgi:hypothetical protein